MSVAADAAEAASLGFRILPLFEKGKRPSMTVWKNSDGTAAEDDVDFITKWFEDRPNLNYGIAMGPFGKDGLLLGAIDIDDKSAVFGPDGYEALREWENDHGELPETVTCKTGSGGLHMFYLFKEGQLPASYANKIVGIDFRGTGSLVVGSGSIHECGGMYLWENHPEDYEIAMADESVMEFIDEFRTENKDDRSGSGDFTSFVMPTEKLKGCRNENTFDYMCSLQARGYDDDYILEQGLWFNDTWCEPPKRKSTVMSSWKSAMKYPKGFLVEDNGGGTLYAAACACEGIEYREEDDPFKNGVREFQKAQKMANGLPAIEALSELNGQPMPPRKPEIIIGTLREQQKLLIQGASKAGKTWLTIELAVALATGTKWLGCECRKGRVLYCDFELQRESYLNRLQSVCDAVGVDADEARENIDLWSLRGYARSMEEMVNTFLPTIRTRKYQMVILDPFYKLMTGSENDAEMVGAFCRELDRLCVEGDIAVTYVHHYSKGAQGDKSPMDRSSGSGVFARDADALIDLAELEVDEDVRIDEGLEEVGCFRVSSVLRDFPMRQPVDVFFKDFHHFEDSEGVLTEFNVATFASKGGKASGESRKRKADNKAKEFCDNVVEYLLSAEKPLKLMDLARVLSVDQRTARGYLEGDGRFNVFKGSDGKAHPVMVEFLR